MSNLGPGYFIKTKKSVYKLKKIIGKGGMGVVWKAIDQATDEPVAIKIPFQTPIAMSKARFEAKLLKILSHKNIVQFIDYIEYHEIPMLIEEFVEGVTLDRLVLEEWKGPGPEKEVQSIITAILLALDYLHSKNIVHRDIKPKNIMLPSSHDPTTTKIVDLGTATYFNISGVNDIVISGGGYTAPEQYMYSALPQSDLWSVAATAFFLATGKDPAVLMGSQYYNYTNKLYKPPDPTVLGDYVGERLRKFILKGMAWNVLDRFTTAREALDYLNGRSHTRKYPHIEVLGIVIPIRTSSLIFGRKSLTISKEQSNTDSGGSHTIIEEENKVDIKIEGDYTIVRVTDPYRWISQNHFEIRRVQNKWCIRDLGSTNKTAIVTRKGIIEVWAGRRVISHCYMLGDKAIILVAYGNRLQNPPYMTVVFNKGDND